MCKKLTTSFNRLRIGPVIMSMLVGRNASGASFPDITTNLLSALRDVVVEVVLLSIAQMRNPNFIQTTQTTNIIYFNTAAGIRTLET